MTEHILLATYVLSFLPVSHPVYMQIDCNKAIMVTLKHDDKLQDGSECAFQV